MDNPVVVASIAAMNAGSVALLLDPAYRILKEFP